MPSRQLCRNPKAEAAREKEEQKKSAGNAKKAKDEEDSFWASNTDKSQVEKERKRVWCA